MGAIKVLIKETLEKVVEIPNVGNLTETEAIRSAEELYHLEKIVLDAGNLTGVDFSIVK